MISYGVLRTKDTTHTILREKCSAVLNVMLVIYSVYAHGFYDTRKAQLKRNLQKRALHALHTYLVLMATTSDSQLAQASWVPPRLDQCMLSLE